jgi:hypothetical protein
MRLKETILDLSVIFKFQEELRSIGIGSEILEKAFKSSIELEGLIERLNQVL